MGKRIPQWQIEAMDWALNKFDQIYGEYRCDSYVQFTGKIGGDVLTYRYYNNAIDWRKIE